MIEFKEIKQYARAMGFKNQKEFREHVNTKRAERLKYREDEMRLDSYHSADPKARSIIRDKNFSDTLKSFADRILLGQYTKEMPYSKHADLVHSHKLIERTKRYNGKYRAMYYNDISFFRSGNTIILKTIFNGKLRIVKVKLPVNWRKFTRDSNGLLCGELGYLGFGGILTRFSYDVDSNSFKRKGIAMELDNPMEPGKKYWEHGLTVRDCLDERHEKEKAYEEEKIFKAESLKIARKKRLIERLCNNLRVTFQDALDSGNCLQGVTNFVQQNFGDRMPVFSGKSFVNNRSITLGELKRFNSLSNARRVVEYVSMMVARLSA